MALSDKQIYDLAGRMSVPLVFCNFKDRLKKAKFKFGKSYIVNLENEFDEDGMRNEGSHYVCFQANKYPTGKTEYIYFDSFGQPPPQEVIDFLGGHPPHSDKDVQSLMSGACGWFCLAFLHYINVGHGRTGDLYTDANHFLEIFDDLNKEKSHLKNEFLLKHFFQSADPALRKPITLGNEVINTNTITEPVEGKQSV
jgi:hypothetical protein